MAALLALCLVFSGRSGVSLADQYRFIESPQWCEARWEFGKAHVAWLQANRPEEVNWIAQAAWCRDCWDQLDNVKRWFAARNGQPANESGQLRALAELRSLIGDRQYYLGIMPPGQPFWWYDDIR